MRFYVVPLAVGLLVLSGCGSKAKTTSTPAAASPSTPSTATSTTTSGATSLTVKETQSGPAKFAYEGLGSVAAGTVTLSFTNAGKMPHELGLARVDAGHSQAEFVAVLKKLTGNGPGKAVPAWLNAAGGIGVTAPGATQTATVILPAGQYYAVDSQGGPNDNGPKAFEQGAISAFTVSGGAATGSLPATTTTITTKDVPGDRHAFEVSGALKTGKNTITFDNTSKQDHHIVAALLLPGKTAADVKKALSGPPSGPPPVDFMHSTSAAVLGYKTKQVTELNFAKPGHYVLLCFLSDRDGKGKPHFLKGMLKPVTIQ